MHNRYRARIQRNGIEYPLGYFPTKAEAAAAVAGAGQLLDRVNSERESIERTIERFAKFVDTGVLDAHEDVLRHILKRLVTRIKMLANLKMYTTFRTGTIDQDVLLD